MHSTGTYTSNRASIKIAQRSFVTVFSKNVKRTIKSAFV